ncbi:cytochrome c-type biogenesis protein [Neptunomonas antarctica]|uniref:Cytochrome c-type biogenesis protein n=1 Tax=Neptunomonas antarctica TaxID=619304 RepID=A0A1N7JCQ3_9GAMM|nr:cytochrome c-type biogenesis protein [Neptunomonas antarctica]SIS47172.1 cytochrome c-type biogenesis protein CcmH [Neptunomonas antarctica]
MKSIIALLLVFVSMGVNAAIDAYEFKDDANRERFQQLTTELRCPKCQNQNLADSNSPIATDLRREVYRMVEAGQQDEEITDFMVSRYGEFVLYRPKVNESTWILWYGPFVLLAVGAVVILLITRKRKRTNNTPDDSLNENEKTRLARLLNKGNVK